ncbi:PilZ domain-containing protein [Methylobacterium sp. WSM2598]|uniref:PilZ domain-containing protein n=1 Tax=Methylobacterium sp. WSM2598 TaxID=398261 RepID=UPI000A043412
MIERRKFHRASTYLGASIEMRRYYHPVEGLVRNLSPGGARIVLTSARTVADCFTLAVTPQGIRYEAKVVWATNQEIGVVFANTRDVPEVVNI